MVIIYTTPNCPFCVKAKEFLKSQNVEYVEYNVAEDKEKAQEMVKKTGQTAVPVLEVNGRIIIGFDVDAIKKALKLPKRTREDFMNHLFYDPFDM